MALSKVRGYNILLTVGGKSIVGTTSDTYAGGGILKESIMKTDAGQTQYANGGYEGTISISAFLHNGEPTTGQLSIENVLTYCRDNTTGTYQLAFGTTSGDPLITGNMTFMSCTVNSNSEDYADCTVDVNITSLPTFTTV